MPTLAWLMIGTYSSHVMVYDIENKKATEMLKIDSGTSHDYKIEQIEELPLEVSDARNYIYYLRTKQNLYCLSIKDHSVKAQYYKTITPSLPKLK
jgi:hypothetical protein